MLVVGSKSMNARVEAEISYAGPGADARGRLAADVVATRLAGTNGPAGGGGVRVHHTPVLGVLSTLVPRDAVRPSTTILEAVGAPA